jgi:acyl transferase domain-containing protein/SAM-dependent methyltransferase/acyl carrier protein
LQQAYISSINDDACVTVTALASDIAGMTENFHARGLRVSPVHVQGRFHSAVHSSAVEKIVKFCDTSDEMQFPTVDKLQVLLRSSLDAKIVMTGSLTSLALENMLLEAPDWYGTVKAAILQLPVGHKVVGFVGFGNHVPASLLQTPGLQVQLLGHEEPNLRRPLETPHANGFKNGTTVGGTRASTNGTSSQVELPDPEYPPHSIAIVGMACRLPEAESVDEFWQLLLSGASIVEPAPERLNLPKTGDYSNTQWWGSFLRDPDAFDHRFFKKSSREALAWDPQLRILIEVVYEAMESSGYFGTAPKTTPSDWGCYIGAVMSNWYDNVSCHPPTAYATTGTSRPFFSGAVSHHFGWTGPALTIDTACSSSLVAINAACRAVMSGECSRAIAGGTNVFTSPFDYRNLQAAGFLSPTGGCKPFDVSGDGYCRGEGIGVVVLKPLADALKENDNILGVIVGSAVNQNENGSHITVPHSGSQINLYKKVMSLAGVEPEAVTYVEAHGTGTGVGDPIESQSIRQAFGGPMRDRTLHFGSVKGNIGHTESTAGVAGIIKVLLMMQHGKIPPQANFSSLNPNIPPLEPDRMEISRKTIPWTPPVHLACVNSYGAAGSNAAVMVRQKPGHAALTNVHKAVKQMSTFPFFISAASASSLSMYCDKLLACVKDLELQQTSQTLLSDLAFNLADRANHSLPHVLSTTVTDVADLEKKLIDIISGANNFKSEVNQNLKPVVFVFGGQENDFVGISEDFSQSFSLFRKHLDQCNTMLISLGFESIYPAVFQRTPISNIVTLHSALFSVQYSSAKAWMDCGLSVSAVIGHSFGQLTALCISGCLSLEDALRLVAGRASIMLKYWGPERGSMLWLGTNRQKVTEILDSLNPQLNGDYIEIACHNGPESHVAVGSANSIAKLENFLANDPSLRGSVRMKKLRVTNGFHSKFTDPLLPHITALAKSLRWKAPAIYLETCDEAESIDEPDYRLVADHTRRPVFFEHAVKRLAHKYAHCTWLETGFGPSFMNLVKGSLAAHLQPKQLFLAPQLTASNAESSLAEITATLWKAGYGAQYWLFHRSQKQKYQFLTLPPYQFEKSRHWLPFLDRAGPAEIVAPEVVEEPPNYELLSFVKFADNSKNEAIFRVSPQSERYQFLVNGHIMAGQALAPASLSFELAARAAIFLQGDSGDDTYVPCVESLHMMSPLGLDIKKDILLSLTRIQDSRSSWSFNITTQAQGANISERFEHTTGTVYLEKRDDIRAAQGFKRFEKLIGSRHDEILNNVEAEKMQGKHVYRAFNTVVFYGEQFRGIKSVSCVRLEAAGKVVISVDPEAAPDQRLCDTPMTDSFMQFAGFLVNYFNNPSMEDVFVCHKIERIEIGGGFTPDAKEWVVYSTMTEDGEREATSDVYVFEAESKKLVMAAFGFHFSRMSQSLLARMLKSVNRSGETSKLTSKATVEKIDIIPLSPSETSTKASASKRAELLDVLHNVTDVPLEEIKDELSLDDLGIDSLMATELLNDIRATFGLAIDLMTFLEFKNVREVWIYLDSKLGIPDLSDTPVSSEEMNFSAQNGIPTDASSTAEHFPEAAQEQTNEPTSSSSPTITSAYAAFETIQYEYDQLATETKAANFWTEVYPDQARLVLAYVVEAFASLGCDMESFQPGDIVSEIESQPRHKNLVRQLYHVLEDAHLISVCDGSFFRTNVPVDTTPAENLYQEILGLHPESANVHKLVKVIGADLAACLTGEKDGLQLVFGNKANKENLGDVYENWPLLRTPTLLLGDFLLNAFSNSTGSGKFRILEVGAGTGGTTRHIVNHLKSHGINFEYTFTDLSASLVSAAKKYFKGAEGMKFEVLDIEKPPVPEHVEAFHVIIATNCIHATRNLDQSLRHLRKMIREDGVLSLVEITKNMFWLDIAVGLFEGWWLFEDGRTHALATETHWELCMKGVGFQNVAWTDGNRAEAKTVRIIAALPRARPDAKKESKRTPQASMETVVYKKFGDTEIHADVYYPLSSETTARKMPIGKSGKFAKLQFFERILAKSWQL